MESTNQAFRSEVHKSVFPTMPRKKLKNPDRIKNIFIEKPDARMLKAQATPENKHNKSKEFGLMASEPHMHGLKQ